MVSEMRELLRAKLLYIFRIFCYYLESAPPSNNKQSYQCIGLAAGEMHLGLVHLYHRTDIRKTIVVQSLLAIAGASLASGTRLMRIKSTASIPC